jgi:segregation and condensation protein B
MNDLSALIEALLFASAQSMTAKRLADLTNSEKADVKRALSELQGRLETSGSGLMLVIQGEEAELVTRPEMSEAVRAVLKAETQGELSRPSMEALAILAYRGPMTRPELEQIRGVQSALILRNLMLRGLVDMKDEMKLGQPMYAVTLDFYKHLGLAKPEELPEYDALRGNSAVVQALQELEEPDTANAKSGTDLSV